MKIRSWEEADKALMEIGRRQEAIAIAQARAETEKEAIGELAESLEAWVRERAQDLKEKSLDLPHGRVWLRWSNWLYARSWKRVAEVLEATKATAYLHIKPKANKEALEKADDDFLKALGIRRKSGDVFGYEVS